MSTRSQRNRRLVLALGVLATWGLANTTATAAAPVNRVELVMDARGFTGPVTGLTFSSDGTMLAASGQREVRIWDLRTGRLLRVVRGEIGKGGFGDALAVAFSHDNCELVVGTREEDGRGGAANVRPSQHGRDERPRGRPPRGRRTTGVLA